MRGILITLTAIICMSSMVLAEGNNYGAASYLSQGIGGRASGMGGAFVALADDATAGYWNPAGLAQMDLYIYQLGTQYVFLPNDIVSGYLSYAFQIPDTGVFSVSWITYGTSKIDRRDDASGDIGTFGSNENAWIISYGRKVYEWVKGMKAGINLKILHHDIDGTNGIGHGLDLAVLWQPILYWDHTIGINIQNLFQQIYWDNSIEYSLVNAKVGVALKFFPSDDEIYFNQLISTIDLEFTEHARLTYRLGIEYWAVKSIAVRTGYNGDEVTAGVSYKPEYYEVDYAFHYELSEIAAHQHRVSVLLRFK